ncbi:hypothetical protein BDV96DRAFT_589655 [Lophiotrema nucula]|uniref:Uncharacterized protein n=1 Tax=Lophiotrema nucula TaxID=690887 RepID=A0A6A5YJD2_9PLEO|nr:hypothetical protein BDV96DRAFT_589655 [Lophiotrema nucula]
MPSRGCGEKADVELPNMASTIRQDALLNDIAVLEVHGREAAFTLTTLSHSQTCGSDQLQVASDVVNKLFAVVGLLPALRRLLEDAPVLFSPQQFETLHRHTKRAHSVCISIDVLEKPGDTFDPDGLQRLLSDIGGDSILTDLSRCFRDTVVVLSTIRAAQLEENDRLLGTDYGARESRRLREALKHPEYSASASLTYESPPQASASVYTPQKALGLEPHPSLSNLPFTTQEVIELQHPPGFRGRYGHPDYPLPHKRAEVYLSPPDPGLRFDKSFEEAELERQQLRDQGRYPNIAAFGNWPPSFIAPNSIQDYQLRSIMSEGTNDVAPQPSSPADTPIDTPASTRHSTPAAEDSDVNEFENIQPEEVDLISESLCATPTPEAMSKNTDSISHDELETEDAERARSEAELTSEAGARDESKDESPSANENDAESTAEAAPALDIVHEPKQDPALKEAPKESEGFEQQTTATSSTQQPKNEDSETTSKSASSNPQAKSQPGAEKSTASTATPQPRSPQFGVPSNPSLFGGRYVPPKFASPWTSLKSLEAYTLQAVSKDIFAGVQWTFETELLSLTRESIDAHLRKLGPDYSVIDAVAKLLPEELRLIKLRVKERDGHLISAEYGKMSTMSTKMGVFEVNSVFFVIQTTKPKETQVLKDALGIPVPYRENHDNGIFSTNAASSFGFGGTSSAAPSKGVEHFLWEKDANGQYAYQAITTMHPFQNLSFEELRMKEQAAGKPLTDAILSIQPSTLTAAANLASGTLGGPGLFGAAQSPYANALAKGTETTGGLFGSSTSQSQSSTGFGTAAKPTTGFFGQPKSTPGFGTTLKHSTGLFGQPSSNPPSTGRGLFGVASSQGPRTDGVFGSSTAGWTGAIKEPETSGGSLFGSSTVSTSGSDVLNQPPPHPFSSLFGYKGRAHSQGGSSGSLLGGTSLFGGGSTTTAAPSSGGFFGRSSNTSTPFGGPSSGFGSSKPAALAGGLFGRAPNDPAPSSGLFGGLGSSKPASSPNSGLFGGAPQSTARPSGSLFGSAGTAKEMTTSSSSGLFGGAQNKTTSSGGVFGKPLFGGADRTTQPGNGSVFAAAGSGSSPAAPTATGGGLFGSTLPTTTESTTTSGGLFSAFGAPKPLETHCRECKINLLFHSDKCRRTGVCQKCRPSVFGQDTCSICHRDDSKPNPVSAFGQPSGTSNTQTGGFGFGQRPLPAFGQPSRTPFSRTGGFGLTSAGAPPPGSDSSEGGIALNLNNAQAEGGAEKKGKGNANSKFFAANKGAPGFEHASSEEPRDLEDNLEDIFDRPESDM